MRLTTYTDYAPDLMHLARTGTSSSPFGTFADLHHISKNHPDQGRSPSGPVGVGHHHPRAQRWLKLGREPQTINVGQVVRVTETDFHGPNASRG